MSINDFSSRISTNLTFSLGIPQIAVASWLDCYDFAARIEHLGIGRWGNKKAG